MDEHQQTAVGPDVGSSAEAGGPDGRNTRWIMELLGVVVVAVVVAVLLRTFVVATYSIPSGSMEPTLQVGDRILVDKLSYHLHGVDRGNIIVFSTPPNEDCAGPPVSDLVKRVVGLPGETISLSGGRVSVDGRILPEPYLPASVRTDTYPGPSSAAYSLHHAYRIPAGDVYVMGDNRSRSCDSRYWGPIAESTIVGKVDMRIWPLSRLGFFSLAAAVPPPDDAQTRPRLVDGADLVVHQPEGKGDLAHHVLVHGRRPTRRSCGPGDPQTTRREDHAAQGVDAALEVAPFGEERHHDVRRAAGLALDGHAGRQRTEQARGRAHERHGGPLADAELLGQRRPAVPRHQRVTAS
jgi:signal peptidase I